MYTYCAHTHNNNKKEYFRTEISKFVETERIVSSRKYATWVWWLISIIPGFGRQQQEDFCVFQENEF